MITILGVLMVMSAIAGAPPLVYFILVTGLVLGLLRLVLGPRISRAVGATGEFLDVVSVVWLVLVILVALTAAIARTLGPS